MVTFFADTRYKSFGANRLVQGYAGVRAVRPDAFFFNVSVQKLLETPRIVYICRRHAAVTDKFVCSIHIHVFFVPKIGSFVQSPKISEMKADL